MKYWWEDEGLCFECSACGACCGGEPGYIWVKPDEIKKIAEFLKLDESELWGRYIKMKLGEVSICEKDNFDCVFLNSDTKKCSIYSVRPKQCVTFPFWSMLLESKEAWDFYALRCKGMNRGKRYAPSEIREMIDKE